MNPLVITLNVLVFLCEVAVLIYRLNNFKNLRKRTVPSYVGLCVIASSVLFTAVAAALVFLTATGDPLVCEIAILTCIFLYTGTKAQLYVFFVERMHVVHKNPAQTRMQSRLYLFNLCLLVSYFGIFTLMIIYRFSKIDDNNNCRIGLRDESTFPLLVYDTLFSIYAVIMFIWPLYKSQMLRGSERLKAVAKKNVIGSVISTVSSFLNIFSLYLINEQLADSCLSFCTLDVLVNVLVMNYLICRGEKKRGDGGENDRTYTSVGEVTKSNERAFCLVQNGGTRVHPSHIVKLVSQTALTEGESNSKLFSTKESGLVDVSEELNKPDDDLDV